MLPLYNEYVEYKKEYKLLPAIQLGMPGKTPLGLAFVDSSFLFWKTQREDSRFEVNTIDVVAEVIKQRICSDSGWGYLNQLPSEEATSGLLIHCPALDAEVLHVDDDGGKYGLATREGTVLKFATFWFKIVHSKVILESMETAKQNYGARGLWKTKRICNQTKITRVLIIKMFKC